MSTLVWLPGDLPDFLPLGSSYRSKLVNQSSYLVSKEFPMKSTPSSRRVMVAIFPGNFSSGLRIGDGLQALKNLLYPKLGHDGTHSEWRQSAVETCDSLNTIRKRKATMGSRGGVVWNSVMKSTSWRRNPLLPRVDGIPPFHGSDKTFPPSVSVGFFLFCRAAASVSVASSSSR